MTDEARPWRVLLDLGEWKLAPRLLVALGWDHAQQLFSSGMRQVLSEWRKEVDAAAAAAAAEEDYFGWRSLLIAV